VLTFGRSVEVPLLHTQLPDSQRRRSHFSGCDVPARSRIYSGMSARLKTTGFRSALWLVLAESLFLCLTSAAIGLALSTLLVPAVSYLPGLGVSAAPVMEIAAAL
jgi:hypothetical protein